MSTEAIIEAETSPTNTNSPTMSAKDRCDSCPSRAVLEISTIYGDFTFCGHHYDKIASQVVHTVTRDDRWTLNSRASGDEVN